MISDFHSWRSLGGILCSLLWFKFISDLNCRFQILNRVIFQIKISKKIPDRYSILKYFKVFFDKLWNNLYIISYDSYAVLIYWYQNEADLPSDLTLAQLKMSERVMCINIRKMVTFVDDLSESLAHIFSFSKIFNSSSSNLRKRQPSVSQISPLLVQRLDIFSATKYKIIRYISLCLA